ncbi:hypothetical protein C8R46DRAFT_1093542, partial [Mycena filopes]
METRPGDLQTPRLSIVYPILTLPPEITTEIFLCCLPEKRLGDVVNTMEAPLLLLQVCSVWRQIAISTRRLWTTFYITDT